MAAKKESTAEMVTEIRDAVRVLRNEAVEGRRILKMLVGVIADTNSTLEAVRLELNYLRTARERVEHTNALAAAVGLEPG